MRHFWKSLFDPSRRYTSAVERINAMRKEQGLELTDRIRIKLPDALSDLLRYEDRIKQETLAVEIVPGGASAEPQIEKV